MTTQQQVSLPSVLEQKLLIVADYQRPYAWGEKQLKDLWEDLDLLGAGRHHYAGTLVLKPADGPPEVSSSGKHLLRHEVVDGQQRMTTCLLLLDRVRRAFEALVSQGYQEAEELAASLRIDFGSVRIDGVRRARLELSTDLNEVWLHEILGDQPVALTEVIPGVARLRAAAAFFDARIATLQESASREVAFGRLAGLMGRVTYGLQFLVYNVESEAEVGVIFETLNERGQNLTELEKVKNYLLYLARQLPSQRRDSLVAAINMKWSSIYRHLADTPEVTEEVLRAHWLAICDPVPRDWKRIRSIKERFQRSKYVAGADRIVPLPVDLSGSSDDVLEELYEQLLDYVTTLEQCSVFAAELSDPQAKYASFATDHERIRAASASLGRTGILAVFRPLLFACRLKHPTDGKLYADLVELCVKYSVRVFLIMRARGNAGEPYLCRIAHDLYEGGDPAHMLSRVRDRLWAYAPTHLVEQRLSVPDNWYARTQAHKFLLYEYELFLARSPAGVPDYRTFFDSKHGKSTEHVLPQNPRRDSDLTLNSPWWSSFTEEEHQTYCNTLGNLVLTNGDSNSSYGTKPYVQKRGDISWTDRSCYFNGKLHQERELATTFSDWTSDTIMQRQGKLKNWALQLWRVEPPSYGEVRDIDEEASGVDYSGSTDVPQNLKSDELDEVDEPNEVTEDD